MWGRRRGRTRWTEDKEEEESLCYDRMFIIHYIGTLSCNKWDSIGAIPLLLRLLRFSSGAIQFLSFTFSLLIGDN